MIYQNKYLIGKQLYNVANDTYDPVQKNQCYQLALFYFQKSLRQNQLGGLYYFTQIKRKNKNTKFTLKQQIQLLTVGAAYGDPLCYFRLSQIYKQSGNIQKYIKYLKIASENGIIQAQHNLGCEYLEGKNVTKDQVKALAWFLHASANGFIESKYNVTYLFLNGSSCGKIKINYKVALLKLQQLKNIGENVDTLIEQVLQKHTRSQNT